MKIKFAFTLLAVLVSGHAAAKTWVLTSAESSVEKGNWKISSDELKVKDQTFSIEQKVLHGGKQEGSKVIIISSKDGLTITLSPTRGMNLLHVEGFGTRLGWNSPVKEVVNPAYINLESRNGLGWLDGFNEMMVRCGYEWTGHPVTADGQIYTLHGRAGNTPVSQVEVEVADAAPHEIRVRGLIKESTFKKADLQTMTELRYVPGTNQFSLHDVLTNHADYPHDYQIIYHSNFGTPILEEGARFLAPAASVSPFNDYAKAGVNDWQTYAGPTKGFDEMVFNIQPLADNNHETLAAVVNKAGDKGASIQFDTRQLPVLTLWKNTDTLKQGYVTGIEPGTSYAYPVTIERQQKRVKQLQPGASARFDLTYTLLHSPQQVKEVESRIASIQGETKTDIVNTPLAKE
ncbi:aldose 1-epimerase family protein [Enterobacter roggenkampii]|uniref:aldose 1-epimerase family protein n=1 Tax=Enterobacter roggenkampii TaxID=1812935 RepID=UPI001E3EE456|nr:aldose 1-epimerase family protein [Enterobacter roggenkampii]MCE1974125.1 aldose 1-epimerase family protein [Enterobacter roggenkampii]MEB6511418.1 aldose 1-epimerase family protein [Enterobacter roggenkampii]